VLHRNHIAAPATGQKLFAAAQRDWWLSLPVTTLERFRIESDLDTLDFAYGQVARITACLAEIAGKDERLPILAQLPGISLINGMTILAAVGVVDRFPDADHLVGYAGLGSRVHDSGLTHKGGGITKSGRRDLRGAMVEAAQTAARTHPHWKAEFRRLERRIGRQKAKVAVARKLLIAVWHVLSKETADRFSTDEQIAISFFRLAYKVGVANLHTVGGQKPSASAFTRHYLDRLGIGRDLTGFVYGGKRFKLPQSSLPA
jgi:transposase